MKLSRLCTVFALLVMTLNAGACAASSPPPRRDAAAVTLLERVKAFYSTLPEWSARMSSSALNPNEAGEMWKAEGCTGVYSVQRPNKFALRYEANAPSNPCTCIGLVSDGQRLMVSADFREDGGKRYSEAPTKPGFASLENSGVPLIEPAMVARSVMASLPGGELFDEPLNDEDLPIFYLGSRDDPSTEIVRVVWTESVMDFSFARGDKPWLLKVNEDYDAWTEMRKQEGKPTPSNPLRGFDAVEFSGWATTVDPQAFALVPPEGAKKMDDIFADLWAEALKRVKDKLPKFEIVGKPAPAASITDMEGAKRTLEEIRGGEVLVLDFWATWCGPCAKSLPEVATVVREFEGRGVKLLAVDVGETPEKVRAAVAKRGWTAPIGLDADQSVTKSFGVKALPLTLVIDRSGTVRACWGGALPDLPEQLRAALTEAVSAKKDEPR